MAVNPNWPLVVTQVAFNAGGNDSTVTPVWTDLSTRVRSWECSSGRQYEIDQNQSGEASATLSDKDEALNPANTASPYYPNVLPYRQIVQQAMWPPAAVGAAVNLFGVSAGYDPDHENTSAGGTPPNLLTFQASPAVGTANPRNGVQALSYAVTGGGGAQYVGLPFLCIPGRQYTASVYVRQSAANTLICFIEALLTGTTSTTTGAYVRLAVTFTAVQPVHNFWIGNAAPSSNSTVYVDQWQLNEGSSALTWNNDGPVVYGVFRGYVERWPASWNHQGLYGICELQAVDALAVLANTKLHTELANAVMDTHPAYYWRLNEGSGATSFGDSSGNSGPSLLATDSKYGTAAVYEPGTASNAPGDPGQTVVAINSPTAAPQKATVVQAGAQYTPVKTQQISIGGSAPVGFSVCVVMSRTATGPANGRFLMLTRGDYNQRLAELFVDTSPSVNFMAGPASGISLGVTVPDTWADGKPHSYVLSVAVDATNYVMTAYVDNYLVGTSTLLTSAFDDPILATQIQVGGLIADVAVGDWAGEINRGVEGGEFSHVALWNRAIAGFEAARIGGSVTGWPGEMSGTRVARYLSYVFSGLYGADTGQSVMGVSALAEGTSVLDAAQNVATSENGNFIANAAGTVLFTSRTSRYLNQYADWALGELESPYEAGIRFDYDPSRVANRVQVTRTGGVAAVAVDKTSQAAYFPREFDREINVLDDNEAVDASNWLLATMKDPHIRVQEVTLNPAANPALWPVALGIAIGDRVTVKRRAISAGLTMSFDFFVEKISRAHSGEGKFTVTLQLSPAIGKTPWILEDPTYGVLGSTTTLGY